MGTIVGIRPVGLSAYKQKSPFLAEKPSGGRILKSSSTKKESLTAIPSSNHPAIVEVPSGILVSNPSVERTYYMEQLANSGDAKAQFHMGRFYTEGLKPDYQKARQMLEQAHNQGHLPASFELAWLHLRQKSQHLNPESGFQIFQQLSQKGNIRGQFNMARCYEIGRGTEKNEAEAFKIMKDLSDKNIKMAQIQMGRYHESGIGCPVDYQKAMECYQNVVSDQNNNPFKANAFLRMGKLYEKGQGVEKSPEQAVKLYGKSADLQEPSAYKHLAIAAKTGNGMLASPEKEATYARKYQELMKKQSNRPAVYPNEKFKAPQPVQRIS